MFETLNLEYVRKRVHGDDSSLTALIEQDTSFKRASEITSDFAITSQRDVATGGMVDKLTARTSNVTVISDLMKCEALLLRMGSASYKYVAENKSVKPQPSGATIIQADVRALFNDTTAVVA